MRRMKTHKRLWACVSGHLIGSHTLSGMGTGRGWRCALWRGLTAPVTRRRREVMGLHKNVSLTSVWPEQGSHLNKLVTVGTFNDSDDTRMDGLIVRDDIEEPFLTIIRLDDGRYILGDECHYCLK
jgi:hypothetical protein